MFEMRTTLDDDDRIVIFYVNSATGQRLSGRMTAGTLVSILRARFGLPALETGQGAAAQAIAVIGEALRAETAARQAGDAGASDVLALHGGIILDVRRTLAALVEALSAETARRTDAVAGLVAELAREARERTNADTAETIARTEGLAKAAQDLAAEIRLRASGDEATARLIASEGVSRSDADAVLTRALADEAKARGDANKILTDALAALRASTVILKGSLTLPVGLALLGGKSERTVPVAGLRKDDNLVVTPNAALPSQVAMSEAYCAGDGVLTVALINTGALLTITGARTIPLAILALRPSAA